jgi:hypothetical protein
MNLYSIIPTILIKQASEETLLDKLLPSAPLTETPKINQPTPKDEHSLLSKSLYALGGTLGGGIAGIRVGDSFNDKQNKAFDRARDRYSRFSKKYEDMINEPYTSTGNWSRRAHLEEAIHASPPMRKLERLRSKNMKLGAALSAVIDKRVNTGLRIGALLGLGTGVAAQSLIEKFKEKDNTIKQASDGLVKVAQAKWRTLGNLNKIFANINPVTKRMLGVKNPVGLDEFRRQVGDIFKTTYDPLVDRVQGISQLRPDEKNKRLQNIYFAANGRMYNKTPNPRVPNEFDFIDDEYDIRDFIKYRRLSANRHAPVKLFADKKSTLDRFMDRFTDVKLPTKPKAGTIFRGTSINDISARQLGKAPADVAWGGGYLGGKLLHGTAHPSVSRPYSNNTLDRVNQFKLINRYTEHPNQLYTADYGLEGKLINPRTEITSDYVLNNLRNSGKYTKIELDELMSNLEKIDFKVRPKKIARKLDQNILKDKDSQDPLKAYETAITRKHNKHLGTYVEAPSDRVVFIPAEDQEGLRALGHFMRNSAININPTQIRNVEDSAMFPLSKRLRNLRDTNKEVFEKLMLRRAEKNLLPQ